MIEYASLPNVRRFIDKVSDTFMDGRNVVFCYYGSYPQEIIRGIQNSSRELWGWRLLGREISSLRPLDALNIGLHESLTEGSLSSFRDLSACPELKRNILLVEPSSESSEDWLRFIGEYEQYCRSVAVSERVLFLIVGNEATLYRKVKEDVCLAYYSLEGKIRRLDAWIVAESIADAVGISGLERELKVSVGVEIGLWDLELIKTLLTKSIEEVMEPADVLRRYIESAEKSKGKEYFTQNRLFEGRPVSHSCKLIDEKSNGKLQKRVWTGQIKVLAPLIEKERLKIMNQLKPQLKWQVLLNSKSDDDPTEEIEIGDLNRILKSGRIKCSSHVRSLVRLLKEIRNDISHINSTSRLRIRELLEFEKRGLLGIDYEAAESGGTSGSG